MAFEKKLREDLPIGKISHPLSVSFLIREGEDILHVSHLKDVFKDKTLSMGEMRDLFKKSYYHGRYIAEDFSSFLMCLFPLF